MDIHRMWSIILGGIDQWKLVAIDIHGIRVECNLPAVGFLGCV